MIFTTIIDNRETGYTVVSNQQLLCCLYQTLNMALDHNPDTREFAEAMQPMQPVLGCLYAPWMTSLQKITTRGEMHSMNFILEDRITEWYIADFTDQRVLVATIRSTPDP